MAMEEAPLTRSEFRAELREELDRSLRHYATKVDVAALETRLTKAMAAQSDALTSAMAAQSAAHSSALAAQTRWLAGIVLAAAAVATSVVIAVDRLAG